MWRRLQARSLSLSGAAPMSCAQHLTACSHASAPVLSLAHRINGQGSNSRTLVGCAKGKGPGCLLPTATQTKYCSQLEDETPADDFSARPTPCLAPPVPGTDVKLCDVVPLFSPRSFVDTCQCLAGRFPKCDDNNIPTMTSDDGAGTKTTVVVSAEQIKPRLREIRHHLLDLAAASAMVAAAELASTSADYCTDLTIAPELNIIIGRCCCPRAWLQYARSDHADKKSSVRLSLSTPPPSSIVNGHRSQAVLGT